MRISRVQFKGQTRMPDGNSLSYLEMECKPGLHHDLTAPYEVHLDENLRMLRIRVVRGRCEGEEFLVPIEQVACLRLWQEPLPKIGEGLPGPGRGKTGKRTPAELEEAMRKS